VSLLQISALLRLKTVRFPFGHYTLPMLPWRDNITFWWLNCKTQGNSAVQLVKNDFCTTSQWWFPHAIDSGSSLATMTGSTWRKNVPKSQAPHRPHSEWRLILTTSVAPRFFASPSISKNLMKPIRNVVLVCIGIYVLVRVLVLVLLFHEDFSNSVSSNRAGGPWRVLQAQQESKIHR